MNRKTLIVGVIVVGIVLTILLVFNLTRSEIGSVFEKEDITKISVFYQPDFSTFDITDPQEIDEFLTIVLDCKVEEEEEGKERVGYIYLLRLFNGDIEYGMMNLGSSITIYPKEYNFVDGDIDQNTLIQYLDNKYKMNMDNR